MSRFRFTAPARRDLEDIWEYIAQDNPVAAVDFIERITTTCRSLANMPYMGREWRDLTDSVRAFSVGRYLIIYRVIGDGVEIVRVAHSARDLDSLFD